MKHLTSISLAAFTLIAASCISTEKSSSDGCCVKPSIETVRVDSSKTFQQISYTIGQNIASDIKKNGIDSLDLKFFNLAFSDVYLNDTNRLNTEQIQKNVRYLTNSLREVHSSSVKVGSLIYLLMILQTYAMT